MSSLAVNEANASNAAPAQTESDEIAALKQVIAQQQTIMDHAASIMLEACLSDDGIDADKADQCLDAIRGKFKALGRNTSEDFLQILCDWIGAAAGFPPGTEFNPQQVLEQMGMTMAVQSRNGQYLELLLESTWKPGTETTGPRLLTSPAGEPAQYRDFPIGTGWPDALQAVLSERAKASAT